MSCSDDLPQKLIIYATKFLLKSVSNILADIPDSSSILLLIFVVVGVRVVVVVVYIFHHLNQHIFTKTTTKKKEVAKPQGQALVKRICR